MKQSTRPVVDIPATLKSRKCIFSATLVNHLKINEGCILLEREEFPLTKRQGREEEEEGEGKKRKV